MVSVWLGTRLVVPLVCGVLSTLWYYERSLDVGAGLSRLLRTVGLAAAIVGVLAGVYLFVTGQIPQRDLLFAVFGSVACALVLVGAVYEWVRAR